MTGNKRVYLAACVFGFVLLAATFVQFCHTEKSVFESRTCPVCHINCASIGVAEVASVFVFDCVLIEMLLPIDIPLRAAVRLDARISRAPPLS